MALILFIDDDPYTLETLTHAVEVLGHRAMIADSGRKALDIITHQLPDLIFTDLRLADSDGISLIHQFKQQQSTANIPIIVLSASPETSAVEGMRAAGISAYITKPIRLDVLKDIIQKYTSS